MILITRFHADGQAGEPIPVHDGPHMVGPCGGLGPEVPICIDGPSVHVMLSDRGGRDGGGYTVIE
jgi:hypothetical protein